MDVLRLRVHHLLCSILYEGKIYPAREAITQAASYMDAAFFEQCCSGCRWYLAEYCSYLKYEQNVNNYFL